MSVIINICLICGCNYGSELSDDDVAVTNYSYGYCCDECRDAKALQGAVWTNVDEGPMLKLCVVYKVDSKHIYFDKQRLHKFVLVSPSGTECAVMELDRYGYKKFIYTVSDKETVWRMAKIYGQLHNCVIIKEDKHAK